MENVVSARRLRKSALNDINLFDSTNKKSTNKKIKFKDKILIKSLICSIILCLSIFLVNNYSQTLLKNKVIKRLVEHYKFNFSKELILENFEKGVINIDKITGDIVPNNIRQGAKNLYQNYIKTFILGTTMKKEKINQEVEIYIYEEENIKEVSNNIEVIMPAEGVITSMFGNRDIIFNEIGTFHTGIDIANDINTDIISISDGIVQNIELNDKYYGRYIEIKSGEYVFKYAHLNDINVIENDNIKKGEIIGKMGSSGMSTGPHLHFEVKKNNEIIDPKEVLNINENKIV